MTLEVWRDPDGGIHLSDLDASKCRDKGYEFVGHTEVPLTTEADPQ